MASFSISNRDDLRNLSRVLSEETSNEGVLQQFLESNGISRPVFLRAVAQVSKMCNPDDFGFDSQDNERLYFANSSLNEAVTKVAKTFTPEDWESMDPGDRVFIHARMFGGDTRQIVNGLRAYDGKNSSNLLDVIDEVGSSYPFMHQDTLIRPQVDNDIGVKIVGNILSMTDNEHVHSRGLGFLMAPYGTVNRSVPFDLEIKKAAMEEVNLSPQSAINVIRGSHENWKEYSFIVNRVLGNIELLNQTSVGQSWFRDGQNEQINLLLQESNGQSRHISAS